jgi:hypothetical protein
VEGGSATFKDVSIWQLKSMTDPSIVVEEPTRLSLVSGEESKPYFSIWPNPSTGNPKVNFDLDAKRQVEVRVYNTLGKLVMRRQLGWYGPGEHTHQISIEGLGEQRMYFMEIKSGKRSLGVRKLIRK